jgi:DNA primase
MISPQSIQQVKDRVDVVEIISSFIKLKKRGANYLGNCPFHNEKSPSFTVSQAKGIYKCFGCGKAGNAITFVQEHEKLNYPDAIKWLAKHYNMAIDETEATPERIEAQKIEESLRIICTYASKYFEDTLWNTTEGQDIGLSYFKERGYREETIKKFNLGYSLLDRKSFVGDALKKAYDVNLLQRASLINIRNEDAYDNYSGRVIFPIHNASGKVIGFGARVLKTTEKAPKYINTQQNEIYDKSRTLYGLYQSRNALSKLNECYLVEGYTDVVSMHQNGVENVVASSGTALTMEQLRMIKRFTPNLTIIYDGDAAGIKAATRGLDMAIEEGLNVQLVLLPDGHDPDSFVTEKGAEGFNEFVSKNKKDIILFKLEITLKDAENDSVKKATLINEIAETLSKINKVEEFTKQQDYIKRCASLLKIDEGGLITLVNKKIREHVVKRDTLPKPEAEQLENDANASIDHAQDDATILLQKDYSQERALIRVLLEYGNKNFDDKLSVAKYIFDKIGDTAEEFVTEKFKRVYLSYHNYLITVGQEPDLSFFTYHESEVLRETSIEATYNPYELSANWKETHAIDVPVRDDVYRDEVTCNVIYFNLRKLKTLMNESLEGFNLPNQSEEEIQILLQMHKQLKDLEKELLKDIKAVLIR